MQAYRRFRVGAAGRAYVEARLGAGNALARSVLRIHRHETGQCISWLPADTFPEVVDNCAHGGVTDHEESQQWLTSVIQSHLSAGADHVVAIEDALSRRGDPVLDRLQSAARYHGNDVYRVLTVASSGEFAIRTTLAEADAPHQLVCVFTRGQASTTSSEEIGRNEIEEWAELATGVAVKAYDGEGYVICSFSSVDVDPPSRMT